MSTETTQGQNVAGRYALLHFEESELRESPHSEYSLSPEAFRYLEDYLPQILIRQDPMSIAVIYPVVKEEEDFAELLRAIRRAHIYQSEPPFFSLWQDVAHRWHAVVVGIDSENVLDRVPHAQKTINEIDTGKNSSYKHLEMPHDAPEQTPASSSITESAAYLHEGKLESCITPEQVDALIQLAVEKKNRLLREELEKEIVKQIAPVAREVMGLKKSDPVSLDRLNRHFADHCGDRDLKHETKVQVVELTKAFKEARGTVSIDGEKCSVRLYKKGRMLQHSFSATSSRKFPTSSGKLRQKELWGNAGLPNLEFSAGSA